ncbi:MAG: DUF421 domain-containing protein [Deltaproteobacteria bacterium]|nr:DUF421 domain-containing protein [Deltaproteobacteria bacterium]
MLRPDHVIETLFGSGEHLTALNVGARSALMFLIALALIRIAGMRSFGRKSAFDSIIVIMLGAVLARAVVGASPFWPTVIGSTVLVVIHRILSVASARWPWFERAVKGHAATLYHDGSYDERALLLGGISRGDLDEAARSRGHVPDHREVSSIVMETSGELTVTGASARSRTA